MQKNGLKPYLISGKGMSAEWLISSLMIRDYLRNLQLRTSCYVSQFLGDNLGS